MADCRTQTMQSHCGCERDPLQGMALAMMYVPWQRWEKTYDLEKALQVGTIFPGLNKPFLGKRGGCR